ncbi:MACPF domain-containing protein CAD1-like [Iris pallida]|uniref:MACPF domain-containing protein CAD1-like n=1 Tax=Iris pallida TaxID=29817 RepID=A0AAX6E3T6_IRIPA|nr:MACPF domain-containing protein CAD1-like [Iris pallida]
MTFLPIISLLDGIHGKDHLTRSITLYLEYKPPIEELRYFLEFQIPRIWAPVRENFPGHQRKEPVCPSLQFSIMGQKLHVSQEQVRRKDPQCRYRSISGIGRFRIGTCQTVSVSAVLDRYRPILQTMVFSPLNFKREPAMYPGPALGISSELGLQYSYRCAQVARTRRARQPLVRACEVEELLPCQYSPHRGQGFFHWGPWEFGRESSHWSSAWSLGFWIQKCAVLETPLLQVARLHRKEELVGPQPGCNFESRRLESQLEGRGEVCKARGHVRDG